jgi:signal transduction histidine kinase
VLERLSIRWRLALISSLLTFLILGAFAVVIGEVTVRRIRSDFNNQLIAARDRLQDKVQKELRFQENPFTGRITSTPLRDLDDFAASENAVIRIWIQGTLVAGAGHNASLGPPTDGLATLGDFRVANGAVFTSDGTFVNVQYGRRLSDLEATIDQVRAFLLFGVLAGSALALAGGLMLARRAMSPITALTRTTREIAETRDPNRRVPIPAADDEVAQLARTLDEMLKALESSRAESATALTRQRQFVADASHELRTPLTSVYANLELLAETLDGEELDAAVGALRSTQRMKRLVTDLLLLARADAHREIPHAPTDVAQVLIDAAAELGPVAEQHEIEIEADRSAVVLGARDDLFRMVLNLLQNAVEHTPPGSHVHAAVREDGVDVVLTVDDDGPGIEPAVRERLFERFVRGAGDRGASTGLGLAIVKAVVDAHGGTVSVDNAHGDLIRRGTRFEVRLPRRPAGVPAPGEPAAAPRA